MWVRMTEHGQLRVFQLSELHKPLNGDWVLLSPFGAEKQPQKISYVNENVLRVTGSHFTTSLVSFY